MAKQSRSAPVMRMVLDAVCERLMMGDEMFIRIPDICETTGVNYGSVYHHFGSREGVIDAAYSLIFSRIVDEDIASLHRVNDSAETIEQYVDAIRPLLERISMGEEGVARRAITSRIVAAATPFPRTHARAVQAGTLWLASPDCSVASTAISKARSVSARQLASCDADTNQGSRESGSQSTPSSCSTCAMAS